VATVPFVRNGWEVPELEATYDGDDDVVPAFIEVVPGVECAGRTVVKYRDAVVGWRYLVQAELDVVKLCVEGMGSLVVRLSDSDMASFLRSGRGEMWERLCGELRWRLLRMRGEVVSVGLNYRSPSFALVESGPGGLEKFVGPGVIGGEEVPEVGRRVGRRLALSGEVISRTQYPRSFHYVGNFRDARKAMDAWKLIDGRQRELVEKYGNIQDYVAFLESRASVVVEREGGYVSVEVPVVVDDVSVEIVSGSRRSRSADEGEPVVRLRRRRYLSVEDVEDAVRQDLIEPDEMM
jgi:hypothetical protein